MTLEQFLSRQEKWSTVTFGHGTRTLGLIEHIRKELAEIEANPHDLEEWCDVIMLAIDGFWRHGGDPATIMQHLEAKAQKNFRRQWLPGNDSRASEHIREDSRDDRSQALTSNQPGDSQP